MGPNNANYGYYGQQKRQVPIKVIALIVGVLALVIVAFVVMQSIIKGDSIGTQSQHLSARLTNLDTLTIAAGKQLANGDLKKLNAEAGIITNGATSDLSTILPKKLDKTVIADEADTSDTQKLASAALAGTYDAEYKQVLQQKLESITALLTEMYTKTNSKTTRTALDAVYKNYQAILTNLSKVTT